MLLIDRDRITGARQALHAHPVGCAQPAAVVLGAADPAVERWSSPERWREAMWALERSARAGG